MYEVIIRGRFITGTTVDMDAYEILAMCIAAKENIGREQARRALHCLNEENAKKVLRDLLRDKLRQAYCLERDQVFEFVEEYIEANPLLIIGKFITGTTVDNKEKAAKVVRDLLRDKLRQADCLERNQVFEFVEESIEVNPLRGGGR